MPPSYHPQLLQILQASLGGSVEFAPAWQPFLQALSLAFADHDRQVSVLQAEVVHRTDQLIASTSHAYSFLDTIHKGFLMCDTSGEVVLTNDSLQHILTAKQPAGIPPTTNTMENIGTLFSPEFDLKTEVQACLKSRQPHEHETVTFGPLILHVSIAPLLSEAAGGEQQVLAVVGLFEDITEQKMLERSKDEFLSIASHELRTPLTAIRGNTALINKYYKSAIAEPEVLSMVDDIHESSIRLIGIVNDFLDVAAMEQGKLEMHPESFALQPIVNEVVRELGRLCADKGITLQGDPSIGAAPAVYADKQRIKQVIINLVGNAVKFTDDGSITIGARHDDRLVYASVTDTGTGMSLENQKLLFRKFQQAGSSLLTRNTSKGTGLGLYISKLIVELSGGTIGLERSELNKGSTFTFSLPTQAPPPPPPPTA